MSPRNDPEEVLGDPQWLPMHIDPARGTLEFVFLPRAEHDSVTFLSDEYLQPKGLASQALPLSALNSAPRPARPAHYIFHSAFCCSTLLARALDLPGTAMGLKEPRLLIELAALFRARRLAAEQVQALAALLARPFGEREAVIVKPGNEANILADLLLGADQGSKALLLYAPLPRFLRSIAKKGMWGRLWGRRQFGLLRRDPGPPFGFGETELLEQTDLQLAALAWLLHQAQFAALLARYPDRVRILDSETFLAKRKETLQALARHFGLPADEAFWRPVAEGKVFAEHSKELGRTFGGGTDSALEASGDGDHASRSPDPQIAEEIDMVCKWAEAVAAHAGIPIEPPAHSGLLAR